MYYDKTYHALGGYLSRRKFQRNYKLARLILDSFRRQSRAKITRADFFDAGVAAYNSLDDVLFQLQQQCIMKQIGPDTFEIGPDIRKYVR